MADKDFVNSYLNDFSSLLKPNDELTAMLVEVKKILLNIKKNNSKVMIFGNGGSAAIASHVSVDITKNAGIRCLNYNEADLITCFANDYGYEKWLSKCIEFYADEKDHLILISSSGKSPNIINAAIEAKKKNILITSFTGFAKNNELSQHSDISFWVDSKAYNIIENTHQIWLLILCDLLKGALEYKA